MSPIFKCLICRKDIERSTKTFWSKKGHLLCSTCLDDIDKKKNWTIKFRKKIPLIVFSLSNPGEQYLNKQWFDIAIKLIMINLQVVFKFFA